MEVRRLTRDDARRIAVRAQLLGGERPGGLLDVVERLTFLQLDPTAAVAPSADLVAWSRLGDGYRPEQLRRALETDRTLFEHLSQAGPKEPFVAMVRPMADLGLFLGEMAAWPASGGRVRRWLDDNDDFRRDVLALLTASGPLASRDLPDTAAVPWASTGWTNDRNVTRMLDFMVLSGQVAVAGRTGRERLWDLASRVYRADVAEVPIEAARTIRRERLLRALGVARPQAVGEVGVPAEIEGTSGLWRVDPQASAASFVGRTALLSPFDRLVHDRKRALELFDFEYTLEMYKPAAKRSWGYFALPVLHHDRLVGKADVVADRRAGVLRVNAMHPDVPFSRAMTAAIDAELGALAAWLELGLVRSR